MVHCTHSIVQQVVSIASTKLLTMSCKLGMNNVLGNCNQQYGLKTNKLE